MPATRSCRAQLAIGGAAYARGLVSVGELATLLSVHPLDALALLDAAGIHRPIDRVILSPEQRAEILHRLRDDRLKRSGRFEPTAEAIWRDVVGSERIEGVDARRWLKLCSVGAEFGSSDEP